MIVTADEGLCDDALVFRDQGKAGFHGNMHVKAGYAWRMSELHAGVGAVHLRRLPGFLATRGRVAARYDAALAGIDGLDPLPTPAGVASNYYKYVVLPRPGVDRSRLKKELKERYGVALSGEVYELPLHQQPVFERYASGPLPVAEDICARHVCLPVHSDMADEEADYVLASLADAFHSLTLDG
jgi:dTDP-4-amino-4,6-dideoxygalactose transaminase